MGRFLALATILVCATAVWGGQLTIVDNLPGTFTDISTTGTPLGLSDDGEAMITWTASNAVFAGGDVWVGNNGGLGFGAVASTNLSFSNQPIPSTSAWGGSQGLLPYWDDIDSDTGDVYWQQIADGTLIVQWHDRPHYSNTPEHATFQVKLLPSWSTVYAQFIYQDIEGTPSFAGGSSATIGYQDGGTGFNDVQWSYNTGGAVSNGTVLSLVPEPASLALLALGALALRRR